MSEKKKNVFKFMKWFLKNTFSFLLIFLFINVFSAVFGSANVLAGVAVAVAFTTLPSCNFGIKPSLMAFFIVTIFFAIGIVSRLSLLNPWLGFAANFIFLVAVLLISCEPITLKPYISFLIAYIFCQTTPVQGRDFYLRIVGLTLGGVGVAVCYLIKRRRENFTPHTLTVQIQYGLQNRRFIFRMAIGIAGAMLMAALLHLQKPLWVSIVVMSLTQIEMQDTLERIQSRTIATAVGIVLFILLFRIIVPPQYDILLILFSGYLSNFISKYKYKQIINAISAINASLVLMDTSTAVINRVVCLFAGIAIVLCLFWFEKFAEHCQRKHPLGAAQKAEG